ncbi:MAG: hypothetical protein HW412_384 [Bacteroidetes bacterium]|nr:hypothetical protein [Bacteroidota bacterium]
MRLLDLDGGERQSKKDDRLYGDDQEEESECYCPSELHAVP